MNQIKCVGLIKTYHLADRVQTVLKDIHLAINKGEFVSIIGPSGSGKSTLLQVISGLESYDSGALFLFDKPFETYTKKALNELKRNDIGFVFQFFNLISNLTVLENIEISRVLSNKSTKKDSLDLLLQLGLSDFKNYYPSMLSGGMQQRVAIARCLINKPQIIFLDEPTGNLDQDSSAQVIALLKKLNIEQQITLILVTHDLEIAKSSDRLIHIVDGKIIKDEKTH